MAVHKPLIEVVHILHVLSPIQMVVNAGNNGSDKEYPHPSWTFRDVGINVSYHSHTGVHVREDGILPIHRNATFDSLLLAALSVQRFIEYDVLVLQAATLKKVGDSLTNTC